MSKAFDWLKKAREQHFAIGAFNVANTETFKAITQAASKLQSPIILEASDGEVNYIGYAQIVALARAYEHELRVPIIVNLDHGKDFDSCKNAIEAGFDYIHIDTGKLPYEQAIATAKEVVTLAHKHSIPVEGEMDHIEGSSADHTKENPDQYAKEELFTDPKKACDFVSRTGVDVFASFVGNIHGIYAQPKHLKLDVLKQIRAKLPNTHLSLHGGSGILPEDIKAAIQLGVVKINVNSELRIAYKMTLQEVLNQSNEIAVYKIMTKPIEEVQKIVEYKIKLFGSDTKV